MANEATIPETVIEGLLALPDRPSQPIVGPGFARIGFPDLRKVQNRRLWAAIPSAHKREVEDGGVWSRYISPEAYKAIVSYVRP